MSIAGLAARLRAAELSPREAVESYLERIAAVDPLVNAYISLRAEAALAEARALERDKGERGPLFGVPVAVKDVIDVAGVPTTAGSRVLADAPAAPADAAAVERLRAAGAVVIGKLNTHEFAYGAMTTSSHFGPARNPWSTERICGGSSGGSGAAAAADLAAGTLGTDTAGSIRIPAAFCGVTGVRPTTGRVSNRGVVPVSWTFDTVGPIARSAEDCALLLEAVAGHDPRRSVHDRGRRSSVRVATRRRCCGPSHRSRRGPFRGGYRPADRHLGARRPRRARGGRGKVDRRGAAASRAARDDPAGDPVHRGDGGAPPVAADAPARLRRGRAGAASDRSLPAPDPSTSPASVRAALPTRASALRSPRSTCWPPRRCRCCHPRSARTR